MGRIFITGVSSGIGEALAEAYLAMGHQVYGLSRRTPYHLISQPGFHFFNCDLTHSGEIDALFEYQLREEVNAGFDVVFFNAGVSGNVPARGEEFSQEELIQVLTVNVLANKAILDKFIIAKKQPPMCVFSASMAGIRFRAGTLTYSVSKAALAALVGVYAAENPEIFFAVLGLCNVNTSLSRQVSFGIRTADFPELKALQGRALSEGYMVSPQQRAEDIIRIIAAPEKYQVRSGIFVDIRTVLREFDASVVQSEQKREEDERNN